MEPPLLKIVQASEDLPPLKIEATSRARFHKEIPNVARTLERDMKPKSKRDRKTYDGGSNYSGPAERRNTQTVPLQPRHQRQTQTTIVCAYCHRLGHHFDVCRKRLRLCLFCGSSAYQMKDCQQATNRIVLGRARGALGAQQRDPLLQIQQLHGALP